MNEGLYPLKFTPILKEKIWGGQKLVDILGKTKGKKEKIGESWEISGLQEDVSVVSNGFLQGNSLQEIIEVYMGDLVGEQVYNKFGEEFPLLIKFIDAQDVLSVQVHPDDETAGKKHNAYGKTEMWYIIQSEKDAELINGFKSETDLSSYHTALQSGNLSELLNNEKVKEGEVYFIPPGRVHAIGKGILLAEIQQTSDITYRIYDWGRLDDEGNPRELHTELADEVIDFSTLKSYRTDYKADVNKTVNVSECEYFVVNMLEFDKQVEKDYIYLDSFVIYMCIEGGFTINYNGNMTENVSKGETVLIPASMKNLILEPQENCKLLEVYIA